MRRANERVPSLQLGLKPDLLGPRARIMLGSLVFLLLVSSATSQAEEVTSGPYTVITPEDYAAGLLSGTFYNPTGVVIGSTLHLFVQGGVFALGPEPWDCPGDKIIRFSTPFTSAGVRSKFTLGERVSPCIAPPPDVKGLTHYGLGSVVQAPWDGQYKIFLDRTVDGANFPEGDFKEVLILTSPTGAAFSYPESINPLVKRSNGISIIDVTLTAGTDRLWGFFKFGDNAADQVGRMQILPSKSSLRGFIVQIRSGPEEWEWADVAEDGSFSFTPEPFWSGGSPNAFVSSGGAIQVWSGSRFVPPPPGVGGCADGETVASTLVFRNATQTTLGDPQQVTSALPWWPLPTSNTSGRRFPFRIDRAGEKLLFLTSADNACENHQPPWPGMGSFIGMEIVLTVLDEPPDPPPVAGFTVSCVGRVCTFDASSSTDNHPIPPTGYGWSFGDGQTGSGMVVSHTYAADGDFLVTLTVTDDQGQPDSTSEWVTVDSDCVPTSTALCLQNGRFKVEVDYGTSGHGVAIPFTEQSGFFRFGNPNSIEVGVKIIDGRPVNGKWWVFHGSLTSVAYTVRVTDTTTTDIKEYPKPASSGSQLCGGADTGAFNSRIIGDWIGGGGSALSGVDLASGTRAGSCVGGPGRICLLGNRFEVRVKKGGIYQNGASLTDGSGTFQFGDPAKAEVPVKIIDGTAVNGKYWVFFGSLTNQSYQVDVTDMVTGDEWSRLSPAPHCGLADTNAF